MEIVLYCKYIFSLVFLNDFGLAVRTILPSVLLYTYRIARNFRRVLIFVISRTVYGVAKIKTAIIYSNRNSKVGLFEIAKIKIAKIISHSFTFKSRKFSSAKISRCTVLFLNGQITSFKNYYILKYSAAFCTKYFIKY